MPDFKTPAEARAILNVYTTDEVDTALAEKAGTGGLGPFAPASKTTINRADIQTQNEATILGRAVGAGNGVPQVLTPAQARAAAGLGPFAPDSKTTIDRADMQTMGEGRFLMRTAGAGTGVPESATGNQAKAVLALDQVNNTSDADKPVSTAQAAAIAVEAEARDLADRTKADEQGEDEFDQFAAGLNGPNGAVHLGVTDEGVAVTGSFQSLDGGDGTSEDAPEVEALVTGAGDDIRIGWREDDDGGLVFEPDRATAGRTIEKAGGVAVLRSGQTAFLTRETETLRIGMVPQLGGFMAEVAELRRHAGLFAMIRSTSAVELSMTMGQSNAGTGGSSINPRKLTDTPFPNSVFGFSKSGAANFQTASGAVAVTTTDTDFLPWQDFYSSAGNPQNQGGMIAMGLEAAYRAKGKLSPGICVHVDWFGGSAISTFAKGTQTYDNLIAHHERAAELAALYGRTAKATAVHYVQGESWSTGYEAALDTLCTDLRADIQTATGQASPPIILVAQINEAGDTTGAEDGVALDQIAVALARPTEVKISTPMYMGRLTDSDIHLDAESRMVVAAAAGDAHRRIITGEGWDTIAFTASRSGATITLDYATNRMDLEFDPGEGEPGDGWIKPTPNYGFGYTDDSSGATITDVAIVETGASTGHRLTRVVLTLSADPGAATGKTVSYARNYGGDVVSDTWAGQRGQLRCRAGRNLFRDMGFNVPEFIWHYAAQQEVSL